MTGALSSGPSRNGWSGGAWLRPPPSQTLGVGVLTASVLGTLTLVTLGIDLLLGWACLQLFERETILTRWTGL